MAARTRVNAYLSDWFFCGGTKHASPSFASDAVPSVKWRLVVSYCMEVSLELEGGGKVEELEPELFVSVDCDGRTFTKVFRIFPCKLLDERTTSVVTIGACVSFNTSSTELPAVVQSGVSRLLVDDDFADFEVRVGEERISIHRALFAAFSPVFKRMFLGDTEEKAQGFVVVEDASAETMRSLRGFLYSGRVSEVRANVLTFLDLGEKYGIEELKDVCHLELRKTLVPANLCERAVLADKYGLEGLFADCRGLVKGEEWGSLTVPKKHWDRLVKEHKDISDRLLSHTLTFPN